MIIHDRPPLYSEIDAAFGIAGKPVIFSWGELIYNPSGFKVSRELLAHEAIHGARQGTREEEIETWWRRYIKDASFRADEEIPAHQAEYRAFCKRHGDSSARRKFLRAVSARLCSPLYGTLMAPEAAELAVLTGKRQ